MNIGLLFVIILAVTAICSIVYLLSKKSHTSDAVRWAITVIASTLIWTLCNFMILRTNIVIGSILNSAAFALGFLVLYSVFILSQYYPTKNTRFRFDRLRYYHLGALGIAGLSALPVVAGSVIMTVDDKLDYTYPPLITLYVAAAFFMVILTTLRFIQIARETKGPVRAQAILLMIGLSVATAFALSANTILPLLGIDVSFQVFGPLIIFFTLAFISYVLSRKAIFDVRPYVARSIVYLISIGVLAGIFITLTAFTAQNIFKSDIRSGQLWFFAAVSIGLAVSF